MNRREFIQLGTFAAATSVLGTKTALARPEKDERLSVFFSDVHAGADSRQLKSFARTVDAILALDPLPARAVCFGDLANCYGLKADYAATRPQLERLTAAGIELAITMGNHDHRANFLSVWPEYRTRTLVPGRMVCEMSLGTCDLILLDSLWEDHTDETKMTKVDGELDGAQWAWLKAELPKRTRPFLLGAHHPVYKIAKGDKNAIGDLMLALPNCLGWINGHDHTWKKGLVTPSAQPWNEGVFRRGLCLPSTGSWGDIGFATMRTEPGRACAEVVLLDHFYPNPESHNWLDEEVLREKNHDRCTFRW